MEGGVKKITGGPGLKKTEHYTEAFADAVIDSFVCYRGHPRPEDTFDYDLVRFRDEDPVAWATGNFADVMNYVALPPAGL
eukprot:10878108-Alexandrium_andersonii.AAC.1